MNIKKGDKVQILTGKDSGKTGKVLQVYPKRNKLSVEGINLRFKNMRPRRQNEKGQRIQFPAPLTESNVALICSKCGKPTRIGALVSEGGKKVRRCAKCKQAI
ncbi:MAG: 50S ribosomal protein L24 [Candidatus Buchananbacteria bacterium RIFCSPHIGHO2_01_FULL_47_11b]|uniref:Large ribosomal subunit protein uL24 n=1 Tax=Candidatus Buchananbacteria bacterium RIFCSPHIGHO2_01_FULL_47_11b TaxID=1797537 RepID=A0A1G1Y304_9BACT|nr:MAG: 50S ribosomal protein L24 [Candidatus Buchananbacteria bacterium RIFCSPHIGHO2_01_FULL_47_11b]